MKVTSKTKEQKSTKERTTLRSISSLLQVSLWKGHCLAAWMLFLGPRGRIILGKQRNSGQDNLHLYWSFFLSNRVLSDTWRLHNIKGHSLVSVLFFSYDTKVLNLLDGLGRRSWNIGCTVLAHLYHLEGGINPRAKGDRLSDGRG